jgi:type IV pilus assembly protein PilV
MIGMGFTHAIPRQYLPRLRRAMRERADMKVARQSRIRQRGSYLLESLIAMLVFSFGVLGLVGALGNSIRATNDARYRSEAANLANAMVADMWTTNATQLDAKFGSGGSKLVAWQTKAATLLPYAGAKPPQIDLTQAGLSSQSRAVIVTIFWQLPGANVTHQYLLTAQIGKNT